MTDRELIDAFAAAIRESRGEIISSYTNGWDNALDAVARIVAQRLKEEYSTLVAETFTAKCRVQ